MSQKKQLNIEHGCCDYVLQKFSLKISEFIMQYFSHFI